MPKTYRAKRGEAPRAKRRAAAEEMTALARSHKEQLFRTADGRVLSCAAKEARGALYGDRVLARALDGQRAQVLRVLERANEEMRGVLGVGRHKAAFDPFERRLPRWIRVEGTAADFGEGAIARAGDVVRVRVVRWEDEGGLLVRVEERLGTLNRARAMLDALIDGYGFPTSFSAEALAQAEACRPAALADDPGREDLRGLLLFTIDGRDAKDFDDAVSLEQAEGGRLRLGVHIADVGHYAPQGSPLDREAFARGTSVYFPGRVLPMLPEPLSNGVCSLRPGEDKFALSALMDVTRAGEVVSLRVARTIIRSRARLVYDDVNALFAGDAEQTARMEALGLRKTLFDMNALAKAMRARRAARGSADFDLDEPEFEIREDGEPTGVRSRARGDAERLIEDFMLAANEQIARMAKANALPILYRVHEEPDLEKLENFAAMLDALGIPSKGLRGRAKPGALRDALEAASGRPEYPAVAVAALSSMRRACYDTRPLGHYGLALADYCHFTSPIRRYPDLVVSRALTAMLAGERAPLSGAALEAAALRSSQTERDAADAEREADMRFAARYMSRHVGETYEGRVVGVSRFTVRVALGNGVEGCIFSREMGGRFEVDARRIRAWCARTGESYAVGDALRVRVAGIDLSAGTVRLVPERGEGRPQTPPGPSIAQGQKSAKKKKRRRRRNRKKAAKREETGGKDE